MHWVKSTPGWKRRWLVRASAVLLLGCALSCERIVGEALRRLYKRWPFVRGEALLRPLRLSRTPAVTQCVTHTQVRSGAA